MALIIVEVDFWLCIQRWYFLIKQFGTVFFIVLRRSIATCPNMNILSLHHRLDQFRFFVRFKLCSIIRIIVAIFFALFRHIIKNAIQVDASFQLNPELIEQLITFSLVSSMKAEHGRQVNLAFDHALWLLIPFLPLVCVDRNEHIGRLVLYLTLLICQWTSLLLIYTTRFVLLVKRSQHGIRMFPTLVLTDVTLICSILTTKLRLSTWHST